MENKKVPAFSSFRKRWSKDPAGQDGNSGLSSDGTAKTAVSKISDLNLAASPDSAVDTGATSSGELSCREFEQMVGVVFSRQGYSVTESHNGAGAGIDLELRLGGLIYLVRCRHGSGQDVGVEVVSDLAEVVTSSGAAGGFLVASGAFTEAATAQVSEQDQIVLVDGNALKRMVAEVTGRLDLAPSAAVASTPSCPSCGRPMVDRVADKGANAGQHFWGCTDLPNCWGTREKTVRSDEHQRGSSN